MFRNFYNQSCLICQIFDPNSMLRNSWLFIVISNIDFISISLRGIPFIKLTTFVQQLQSILTSSTMNFTQIVILLILLVNTCYQAKSQSSSCQPTTNNQTKDTDELFELSSISTLLIPHDSISNQTKLLRELFSDNQKTFTFSLLSQQNSSLKLVVANGRKSNYTKRLIMYLDVPNIKDKVEDVQIPLLFEFRDFLTKLVLEEVGTTADGTRYRRMSVFNASSEQNSLLYEIKYVQFKELSLTSSQMSLQLIFTDRLTPYKIKYCIFIVINIFLGVLLIFKYYIFCQAVLTDSSIFFFLYILGSFIAGIADIAQLSQNSGFMALPIVSIIIMLLLLIIGIVQVQDHVNNSKKIGPENVSLKINRKLYWITTLIILFNHSLPMIAVHTAANIYTLSRETRRKSQKDNQIRTKSTIISMIIAFWMKVMKDCSIGYFPGFFDDSFILNLQPMSYLKLFIVEINLILTLPIVSGFMLEFLSGVGNFIGRRKVGAQVGSYAGRQKQLKHE